MPNYKLLAETGKYPSCYKPCIPFYQFCVKGDKIMEKPITTSAQMFIRQQCVVCIKKFEFVNSLGKGE